MTKKAGAPTVPHGLLAAFLDYRPALASHLRHIVTPHEIDDVLQDTFVRLQEAAKREPIEHPRAFLRKTATNLALNRIAKADRRLNDRVADFESSEVCSTTDGPDSALEAEQRTRQLYRAVARLPQQCRYVFLLKKVFGFSQQEIALALGISTSTVEKHIAKGLLMCRDYLRSQRQADRSTRS